MFCAEAVLERADHDGREHRPESARGPAMASGGPTACRSAPWPRRERDPCPPRMPPTRARSSSCSRSRIEIIASDGTSPRNFPSESTMTRLDSPRSIIRCAATLGPRTVPRPAAPDPSIRLRRRPQGRQAAHAGRAGRQPAPASSTTTSWTDSKRSPCTLARTSRISSDREATGTASRGSSAA